MEATINVGNKIAHANMELLWFKDEIQLQETIIFIFIGNSNNERMGLVLPKRKRFFGLENMVGLNRMGNVVLWIEAVKQINETQLWIEFDNFKILESA